MLPESRMFVTASHCYWIYAFMKFVTCSHFMLFFISSIIFQPHNPTFRSCDTTFVVIGYVKPKRNYTTFMQFLYVHGKNIINALSDSENIFAHECFLWHPPLSHYPLKNCYDDTGQIYRFQGMIFHINKDELQFRLCSIMSSLHMLQAIHSHNVTHNLITQTQNYWSLKTALDAVLIKHFFIRHCPNKKKQNYRLSRII